MKFKTTLALLSVAAACLMSGPSAQATPYEDFQLFNPEVIGSGSTFSGSFDLTADGYDPINESLASATAKFQVANNGEVFNLVIKLGADLLDSLTLSQPAILADIAGNVIGAAWFTLDTTGKIGFSIQNSGLQEIMLNTAWLEAEAVGRSGNPVPEGGATVGLLAIAIVSGLGAGLFRRKIAV